MVQQEAGRLVQQGGLLLVQGELGLVLLQVLGTGLGDLLVLGTGPVVSLSRLLSLWVQGALESQKFQVWKWADLLSADEHSNPSLLRAGVEIQISLVV